MGRCPDPDSIPPSDWAHVQRFSAFLADAGPSPGQPGFDAERAVAAIEKHYPEEVERVERELREQREQTSG